MKTKHILYAIVIALSAILIVAIGAAAITQLATNTNTGTLASLDLFTYTIDGTSYTDGDSIDWGIMIRGINTVDVVVTNIHTEQITAYFLNGTAPVGWTITAVNNASIIPSTESRTIAVTWTIPTTEPLTSFSWITSVYATAA